MKIAIIYIKKVSDRSWTYSHGSQSYRNTIADAVRYIRQEFVGVIFSSMMFVVKIDYINFTPMKYSLRTTAQSTTEDVVWFISYPKIARFSSVLIEQ